MYSRCQISWGGDDPTLIPSCLFHFALQRDIRDKCLPSPKHNILSVHILTEVPVVSKHVTTRISCITQFKHFCHKTTFLASFCHETGAGRTARW